MAEELVVCLLSSGVGRLIEGYDCLVCFRLRAVSFPSGVLLRVLVAGILKSIPNCISNNLLGNVDLTLLALEPILPST